MHRVAEDGEGAGGGPDNKFGPHHRQICDEEASQYPANLGRAIAWAASGRHGWNLTGAGDGVNPTTSTTDARRPTTDATPAQGLLPSTIGTIRASSVERIFSSMRSLMLAATAALWPMV